MAIDIIPLHPLPHPRLLAILITTPLCLGIAWLVVCARLWTRLRLLRAPGLDDLFMAIAIVCFTIFCAAVLTNFVDIGGRIYLSAHLMTLAVDFLLVAETFYTVGMVFIKLSLGFFFLRITVAPYQRLIVRLIMIVYTMVGIAYFFFTVFQCGAPIQGPTFWMKTISHRCQKKSTALGMAYMHGVVTALTDVLFASLPIPMLRQSMMPRHEKIMVGGILLVATMGSTASIARTFFIKKLTTPGLDYWNNMALLAITSTIESGLAISAASLATLRPLLRAVTTRIRSYRSGGVEDSDQQQKFSIGPAPRIPTQTFAKKRGREPRGLSTMENSYFDPMKSGETEAHVSSGVDDEEAQKSG